MLAVGVVVQLPAHALWVGLIPVLGVTAESCSAVASSATRSPTCRTARALPSLAPAGLLRQLSLQSACAASAARLNHCGAIFGGMLSAVLLKGPKSAT